VKLSPSPWEGRATARGGTGHATLPWEGRARARGGTTDCRSWSDQANRVTSTLRTYSTRRDRATPVTLPWEGRARARGGTTDCRSWSGQANRVTSTLCTCSTQRDRATTGVEPERGEGQSTVVAGYAQLMVLRVRCALARLGEIELRQGSSDSDGRNNRLSQLGTLS
jgi:hypothetical protein